VRRLKAIVTVLVLAVWSACTAHCAIENLTRTAELPCCNEDGGQSGQAPNAPGHCACSAIQSGGYVSQESALSIPLPLDGLCLFDVAPREADLLTRPGIVEVTMSPPELVRSWQFLSRVALPARAPSVVS